MRKSHAFAPKERVPSCYEARRIYGVTFKSWESRAVSDRIDRELGYGTEDFVRDFGLTMRVHDQLREEHNMVSAYIDDVQIRICIDLGIDWKVFPHNTPVEPLDAFIAHAKRKLVGFKLATNDTRWHVQSDRIWQMFREWARNRCTQPECEDGGHIHCDDNYVEFDTWEVAKLLAATEDEKAKLITSLDAKPKPKAVKAATDALARIAVAKGSQASPKRAATRGTP
jgi:hypothetical protein